MAAVSTLALPVTFELLGPVPAKKQNWRPGKNGKVIFYGRQKANGERVDVRQQYKDLITQARIVWGPRRACVHPSIQIQFFVTWRGADRDNKLSTVLDALVEAGVLQNDNIAQFNGNLRVLPAVVSEKERTVIRIVEEESGE